MSAWPSALVDVGKQWKAKLDAAHLTQSRYTTTLEFICYICKLFPEHAPKGASGDTALQVSRAMMSPCSASGSLAGSPAFGFPPEPEVDPVESITRSVPEEAGIHSDLST